LLLGKIGEGMERCVDFHLHVENLIRYHVPAHHTLMEEAPENGKELSHSARTNGINE